MIDKSHHPCNVFVDFLSTLQILVVRGILITPIPSEVTLPQCDLTLRTMVNNKD